MSPIGPNGSIYDAQHSVVYYEKVIMWASPSMVGNCGDVCIVHNLADGKIRFYFHNGIEWVTLPRDQIFDGSWKDILLAGDAGGMEQHGNEYHTPDMAEATHGHVEADVTDLIIDLASKETLAGAQTKVDTHAALTATHGVAGTIAGLADIATHAALIVVHGVGGQSLLSNFTTSSTTRVSTNLTFAILASEVFAVDIYGTCSKATTATGLKFAIDTPVGCTIVGFQLGGAATLAAPLVPSLITAINTLGATLATGIGIRVAFALHFRVVNGATPGNITLQVATVTSNVATIYAGTKMNWQRITQV